MLFGVKGKAFGPQRCSLVSQQYAVDGRVQLDDLVLIDQSSQFLTKEFDVARSAGLRSGIFFGSATGILFLGRLTRSRRLLELVAFHGRPVRAFIWNWSWFFGDLRRRHLIERVRLTVLDRAHRFAVF